MTDKELNELQLKIITAKETDTECTKALHPYEILELIKELRQTQEERNWLRVLFNCFCS